MGSAEPQKNKKVYLGTNVNCYYVVITIVAILREKHPAPCSTIDLLGIILWWHWRLCRLMKTNDTSISIHEVTVTVMRKNANDTKRALSEEDNRV